MLRISTATAAALVGLVLAGGPALAQSADDAFGVWLNPENQSNIEFYKCGDGLCAKITKGEKCNLARGFNCSCDNPRA